MTTTRCGLAEVATAACRLPPLSTYLARVLDDFAIRRLAQRGVPEPSRCLAIGAGAGSVAGWLAGQLGGDGEVVVTDTDPRQVPAHPGVTALRHDLATDPLAEDSFQLIYARSTLALLPSRREQLAKLVSALAPGGTIVLDELETGFDAYVLDAPDPAAGQLFARYRGVFEEVLRCSGTTGPGRPPHQILAELGLIDVDTECWARSWRGGEPGCLLLREFAERLSGELGEAGMSRQDLFDLRVLLLDRRLVIRGCLAMSTAGTKPTLNQRDQLESRSSSRWNSHAPAAWRPGRPPSG